MIELIKVTKRFGNKIAVDDLSLHIKTGEFFGFLGPNGAGKTTLIEMIEGLRTPDGGSIKALGLDPNRQGDELREKIGVLLQTTSIQPDIKVKDALKLFASFYQHPVKNPEDLLHTLALEDKADSRFKKLSGGLQQRTAIALALVNDPVMLFLDELTTGLDPQARRTIWEYIAQLKGKKTILLTTHYMEEADSLSDRIGIIDEGRVVALGTSQELKTNIFEMRSMVVSTEDLTAEVLEDLQRRYSRLEKSKGRLKISHKDLDFKEIVDYLHSRGVTVYSAALEQPTLEDVFIQITGKKLRD